MLDGWLPDTLVQAMDRVESNLDLPWTLESFADAASFSPFHFHRSFRRAIGETPVAFVERLRLERAALLLLASETSITELAWDVGFRNPETFARRFRARFEVAARDYRRQQLESWRRLGLEAGADPAAGTGTIELRELEMGPIELRRRFVEDEGFDFAAGWAPWNGGPRSSTGTGSRLGRTLDWPGITQMGGVRQDWARTLDGRPVTSGWVRSDGPSGLYATLEAPGPGPVDNLVYQRLFVWALAGRHRLRVGPIVEIDQGDTVLVCQPVTDTKEE